jgi:hypothetical protein
MSRLVLSFLNFSSTYSVLVQPGDEVVAVLCFLETSKGHLCPWNILLGVLKVVEERLLLPVNTLGLVGRRVRVALDLTALATEKALQSEE